MHINGAAIYLMAAGAVVAVVAGRTVLVRARRTRPGELGRPYGHTELSLLAETTARAVLASLGALRAAGAVDTNSWGGFAAAGPLPSGASVVDRAVYAAAARRASWRTMTRDEGVAAAVAVVEAELRAAGALLKEQDPGLVRRVRWWMLGALLAVAVVVPVAYGEPFWWGLLVVAAFPLYVLIAVGAVRSDGRRSRLGNRILKQARPVDLGTAVALEGVDALWAADRPFAARARLPERDPDAPEPEVDY